MVAVDGGGFVVAANTSPSKAHGLVVSGPALASVVRCLEVEIKAQSGADEHPGLGARAQSAKSLRIEVQAPLVALDRERFRMSLSAQAEAVTEAIDDGGGVHLKVLDIASEDLSLPGHKARVMTLEEVGLNFGEVVILDGVDIEFARQRGITSASHGGASGLADEGGSRAA